MFTTLKRELRSVKGSGSRLSPKPISEEMVLGEDSRHGNYSRDHFLNHPTKASSLTGARGLEMNVQLSRKVWEDYGSRGWRSAEAIATCGNTILKEEIVRKFDETPQGSVGVETVDGQRIYLDPNVARAFGY